MSQPKASNPALAQKKQKTVRLSEDKKMEKKLNDKKKEMSTDFDVTPHLVIDLGNAFTKIGYAGNDLPTLVVPSIHAKSKTSGDDKKNELAFEQKLDIFGYEAKEKKYEDQYDVNELTPGDHKLKASPEFVDFLKEMLEKQLQLTPSDYSVIVNMSPIINRVNVREYLRMFFDEIQFKSMAIVNNASLTLFSTGRTSGMVVQCGETRTYTVPIYEGFPLRHALSKNSIGGKHLTQIFEDAQFKQILPGGEVKEYTEELHIKYLRGIKEKACYVKPTYVPYEELKGSNDLLDDSTCPDESMRYKLPDETILQIPRENQINASELLFTPSLLGGSNEKGLSTLLASSFNKATLGYDEFKSILNNNIVLGGGTSMMPGLGERISKDLYKNNQDIMENRGLLEPQVISENSRGISKWVGMSMIASMSAFDKLFIDKSKYTEAGDEIASILAKIF